MKTIVCYGDSNTYGYNPENGFRYEYEERWTTILQKELKDSAIVIPEGLNGRTTSFEDELRYIGVKYNIDSIGIFGSRARGDFREDSDYDIFIIGEISLSDELKLEEEISDSLKQDVDVIKLQPGKDMVTLISCHPYVIGGGPYRYIVYCERVGTEEKKENVKMENPAIDDSIDADESVKIPQDELDASDKLLYFLLRPV